MNTSMHSVEKIEWSSNRVRVMLKERADRNMHWLLQLKLSVFRPAVQAYHEIENRFI